MRSEKQKQSPEKPFSTFSSANLIYLAITLLLISLINFYLFPPVDTKVIPYSKFLEMVEQGSVESVTITDSQITGENKREQGQSVQKFSTTMAKEDALTKRLFEQKIPFRVEEKNPLWGFFLSWLIPGIFIYFIWSLIGRKMAGISAGMLPMTKSKAKVYMEKDVKTTFDDVAGIEEAKGELSEIINYLQDPKRYTRLGGRAPKGVLLVGLPGTGKTLLARAVAGEAKVPFFSINGSEFVEMFVGLGAARVRDLFEQARKQAPCILFIDEIDALGKSRALGIMGSGANDEKEQTLNQLLAEMDGFDSSEGVIMLAATNRPEILDPALLRAGRFDRQIVLSNPDHQGRIQILRVHVKKIKLDPQMDLARVASMTPGFSGADLANLVNEAAIVATRKNAESVTEKDFTEAIERIVAGLEKKSKVMNADEKRRVASHELGHATVALALNVSDKVQKISIVPRGMNTLGYTLQRPLEDRYLLDEDELHRKIAVLLGGRASEILNFNNVSTGAADDLAKASDIARSMVTQFGMSKRLGLENMEARRSPFLPSTIENQLRHVSEATLHDIDVEVKAILDRCLNLSLNILKTNSAFLNEATEKLLKAETLDESEIASIWRKHNKSLRPLQLSSTQ